MLTTHTPVIAVPFAAALHLLTLGAPRAAPPAPAAADEGITVIDFATGTTGTFYPQTDPLRGRGILRRGTTSTVRIVKHGIDLIPGISFEASDVRRYSRVPPGDSG